MKNSILQRIQALGGNVANVKGNSLLEDIQAIHFDKVLHFKLDNGGDYLYDFCEEFYEGNKSLYQEDKQAFIEKAIENFYISAEDEYTAVGQQFWRNWQHFTPLTPNTADYDEWSSYFEDIDLSQCLAVTGGETPEFIIFMFSYGFPDHYFICSNDKNAENPTVFGTDHEEYFYEIENCGDLETFVNTLMTEEECKVTMTEIMEHITKEK